MFKFWPIVLALLVVPLALYWISPLLTIGYLYIWIVLPIYMLGMATREVNQLKDKRHAD